MLEWFVNWFRERKWEALTALAVTVLLAVTVGPWVTAQLFTMATNLVGTIVALMVVAGLVILAPVFFYALSLFAYRGEVWLIRKDPVAAIARELSAVRKIVADSEVRLGRVDNKVAQIDEVIRIRGHLLTEADQEELQSVRGGLLEDRKAFDRWLGEDRQDLQDMEREMVRSEVKEKILGLFSEAADDLAPARRRGLQSDAARIALRTLAGKAAEKRTLMQTRLRARLSERERTQMPRALPSGQRLDALLLPSGTREGIVVERKNKKS